MKSVAGDVQALLEEYGDERCRSCALLASELIAQVIGREPSWEGEPVELTIQARDDVIRLEVTGRAPPAADGNGRSANAREPLAEWGRFLLDRLSDRWGVRRGPRRDIWAEIRV